MSGTAAVPADAARSVYTDGTGCDISVEEASSTTTAVRFKITVKPKNYYGGYSATISGAPSGATLSSTDSNVTVTSNTGFSSTASSGTDSLYLTIPKASTEKSYTIKVTVTPTIQVYKTNSAVGYYCERTYGITALKTIEEAVHMVANRNAYHPVRDFPNSLEWDGQERVRYALHRYLGADTSDYTYEILKFFMLGAVSRVFRPGVKFDYIICVVGDQGAGKSSFFRLLAVEDEWFTDDLKDLESNKVYEKLQGHWIIELSEMLATNNAKSNEAIKSFLNRQKEIYRTPYERYPKDRPR